MGTFKIVALPVIPPQETEVQWCSVCECVLVCFLRQQNLKTRDSEVRLSVSCFWLGWNNSWETDPREGGFIQMLAERIYQTHACRRVQTHTHTHTSLSLSSFHATLGYLAFHDRLMERKHPKWTLLSVFFFLNNLSVCIWRFQSQSISLKAVRLIQKSLEFILYPEGFSIYHLPDL